MKRKNEVQFQHGFSPVDLLHIFLRKLLEGTYERLVDISFKSKYIQALKWRKKYLASLQMNISNSYCKKPKLH